MTTFSEMAHALETTDPHLLPAQMDALRMEAAQMLREVEAGEKPVRQEFRYRLVGGLWSDWYIGSPPSTVLDTRWQCEYRNLYTRPAPKDASTQPVGEAWEWRWRDIMDRAPWLPVTEAGSSRIEFRRALATQATATQETK